MFCMNCGTQLPDGAKFCMNCGTKVGEVGAGAVPSGKKYPSYAMLYPDSMAYLESPCLSARARSDEAVRAWRDAVCGF